ncbi:MAG TPA: UDP-3-O-acyl-N-acetylglucosamine deacetylase, partial [Candidatus Tumulicola sp.]|nr:UDP-3-O-acyl-N-acetylglucosamine deacetylase [Candidatus Tumulicola sp.]
MSDQRHSIAQAVSLEGIGLHLGRACRLTFRPAEAGTGVVFRRVDLSGEPSIPARADFAVLSDRRTQLGSGPAALHTVEHVLAAVAAQDIDDLVIEMDGPEPPILDGSAAPYFDALGRAGIADRGGAVQYLAVTRPMSVKCGESMYEVLPAPSLSLKVTIDFPHPLIGRQTLDMGVTRDSFARELAGARTFGFTREVEMLS